MQEDGVRVSIWAAALGLIAAAGVGVLAGARLAGARHVPLLVAAASPAASARVSFESGFAPVARGVLPGVVNIASSKIVRAPEQTPFFMDPFFEQFFGRDFSRQFRVPRERREQSLGSGVIVSPDGYILTNNHVVDKATDIKIFRDDQQQFKARVVGTDPKTDIAVLKIDVKGLPALTLGDSSKVQVGDFALAIGNPFGVGQTVTMGIVSATGRGGFGIEDIEDFIQTDASINPGNSGGALVNVRGEVIGINTAILSRSGGNQGIGFAVPINMARSVMEQIIRHGKVVRGWLGVLIQPVNPAAAKAFGLAGEPRGALIGDVTANSPASRAGLHKGDIVLEMNGEPIRESRDLQLKVGALNPGAQVRLKVFRDGKELEIPVTLGEMPSQSEPASEGEGGEAALEGLSVDTLTPQIARQLDLPARTRGVVVTDVQPGSLAAEAGLRRGDVIQEVNRKPVATVEEFQRAVRAGGRQPVLLLINRGGSTSFVAIEPR